MILQNNSARLITINHNEQQYIIRCGTDNKLDVPKEIVNLEFTKQLIKSGDLIAVMEIIDDEPQNPESVEVVEIVETVEAAEDKKIQETKSSKNKNKN